MWYFYGFSLLFMFISPTYGQHEAFHVEAMQGTNPEIGSSIRLMPSSPSRLNFGSFPSQFRNFDGGQPPNPALLKALESAGVLQPPVELPQDFDTLEPPGPPRPVVNVLGADYLTAVQSLSKRQGFYPEGYVAKGEQPIVVRAPIQSLHPTMQSMEHAVKNPMHNMQEVMRNQQAINDLKIKAAGLRKEALLREMLRVHGGPADPSIGSFQMARPVLFHPSEVPRQPFGLSPHILHDLSPAQSFFNNLPLENTLTGVGAPAFQKREKDQPIGAPTEPFRVGPIDGFPVGSNFQAAPDVQGPASQKLTNDLERKVEQSKKSSVDFKKQLPNLQAINSQKENLAPVVSQIHENDGAADGSTSSNGGSEGTPPEETFKDFKFHGSHVNASIVTSSKFNCAYTCHELEKIFDEYNLSFNVFEIDSMENSGKDLLLFMYRQTGIKEMPQVYICDHYVGGFEKTRELHKLGKLRDIVKHC